VETGRADSKRVKEARPLIHAIEAQYNPQSTVHSAQLKDNAQCTMHNAQLKDGTIHGQQNGDKKPKSETVDCGLCTVDCENTSPLKAAGSLAVRAVLSAGQENLRADRFIEALLRRAGLPYAGARITRTALYN
jgi:hypothetical protein